MPILSFIDEEHAISHLAQKSEACHNSVRKQTMVTMERLIHSPCSYVAYNAAASLNLPEAMTLRDTMIADPSIILLIDMLALWPGPSISSHKSASQFFHTLVFLSDIGICAKDPGMAIVIEAIMDSLDEDCIPCLPMVISSAHGGSGKGATTQAWALCDAPNTLYALVKFGVTDPRIDRAVERLASFVGSNGCGCAVSKALGSWRGPGKKSDPCPYATLIVLRLLTCLGEKFSTHIELCAECILDLWEHSREKHPFIFYMGTDFRKLKLPYIWYDILNTTDILARTQSHSKDPRLAEMLRIIQSKETAQGYIPESVYLPWKDWDFGQKKAPSDWLTFQVRKIEAAIG